MSTPLRSPFPIRLATLEDLPAIERLITASVEQLSVGYYTPAQIASGLRYVFGPDTQLILDGTYFAVTDGAWLIGAGGWSRRRTLYGGNQMKSREDPLLDPTREAARIRAYFVDPEYARRGIGRQLLDACACSAAAAGFGELVLVATLPGVPFYAAAGFRRVGDEVATLPDGVSLPFVRMGRSARVPDPGP